MKTMYIIEVPRKEMETKEDVFRLLGREVSDVLWKGFLKQRNTPLRDRLYHAHADVDYLMDHTLREWYENHIFFVPEESSFVFWHDPADDGYDSMDDCGWMAEEYFLESNLPYRKVLI